jgi:mono/diheme cytochrome c family protein
VTTLLFVLFFLILGAGVVLVAMRSGSSGPVLDSRKKGARRLLAVLTALAVLVFVIAVPVLVASDNRNAEATAGSVTLNKTEQHGRQIFNQRCVQCHTLAASSGVQQVGPDLDKLRPPKALVLDAVEKGRARGQGQMPALLVTGPDAEAVAEYVAKVAGRE